MRISKLLVATTLALPATVTPLGIMTSCANAWGHKTPVSTGSIDKTDPNNPYYNFIGSEKYYDADGKEIPSYLPSNYIQDMQKSINYAYTTPIETWYETKDGKSTKLSTDKWVDGASLWATPSNNFSTSITQTIETGGQKYNITQSCSQNITLSANVSFVNTIAQFINKYVTYAINYATSQVHEAQDFSVAWGGTTPTLADQDKKRTLYEWMFANSNAHATSATDAFLKTTNVNFNFSANSFPVPAYKKDKVNNMPVITEETAKLLSGQTNPDYLGSKAGTDGTLKYWSTKTETGKDDDKYTVYTYPAVPVLVKATNLTQRFINPKNKDSIFINDYYQNDKTAIQKAVGETWSKMKDLTQEQDIKPSIYKYDITTSVAPKPVTYSEDRADKRLKNLDPKGNDFIAFITYNYVEWNKPNAELNRYNTVTLSSLQTMMPAYILNLKDDIYKQVQDNAAYIIDVNKADKYSTELINLLSRNSDQGRISKARNLNEDSKKYLQFLNYLFGKDGTFDFDFVDAIKF